MDEQTAIAEWKRLRNLQVEAYALADANREPKLNLIGNQYALRAEEIEAKFPALNWGV